MQSEFRRRADTAPSGRENSFIIRPGPWISGAGTEFFVRNQAFKARDRLPDGLLVRGDPRSPAARPLQHLQPGTPRAPKGRRLIHRMGRRLRTRTVKRRLLRTPSAPTGPCPSGWVRTTRRSLLPRRSALYAPHFPNYCPQKYFDLYDRETRSSCLPYKADDLDDLPERIQDGMKIASLPHPPAPRQSIEAIPDAIHGYLACISYADALKSGASWTLSTASPYADNTVIVLWSPTTVITTARKGTGGSTPYGSEPPTFPSFGPARESRKGVTYGRQPSASSTCTPPSSSYATYQRRRTP